MLTQCECCGKEFERKHIEVTPAENTLQALCQIVGSYIFESVCDDKQCQAYAQHQCDEFDAARKEEY